MEPNSEPRDTDRAGAPQPTGGTPYRPNWNERLEEWRAYVGPALAVLVLIVMGAVVGWRYYSTLTRESPVDRRSQEASLPVASGAGDDESRLAVVDRLIARQGELMRAQGGIDPEQKARLARLEEERAVLRVRLYRERSRRAELDAGAAEGAGQAEVAREKWEEALRWQHEANVNQSPADVADVAREARLAAQVDDRRAAGLLEVIVREKARAEQAERAEDWAVAGEAYAAWRAAQATLNERLPASRHADPRALDRLDNALASTKAASLAATVARQEADAVAAERAGSRAAAAEAMQAALKAQLAINADLPGSRYASAERATELDARWQTLAAAEGMQRVRQLAGEARAQLQQRDLDGAAGRVEAALAAWEESAAAFPRSRGRDPALRRQLVFLDLRRAELAALQQALQEGLRPLPEGEGVRLLATEVSQRLYERLMNHNPSLRVGPGLPVESVSWPEAAAFCERAGWILGRTVRLPTEAEFRAGLAQQRGVPRLQEPGSGRQPRPIASAGAEVRGFADLIGNVAEWLGPGTPFTAEVAGGSYLTPAPLATLPLVTENKTKRSPQIGFRFVVE
jgi:hypothetical protein